jgi:uncharacterized RDD family membrane protein YckC
MTGARARAAAPALWRRLASFLYEGVLLFGVLAVAALAYGTLTDQRHALRGSTGLQVVLFVVLGAYFVTFWSRGGQTLAMKTWQLRLVRHDGAPVGKPRAFARYVLSWLWFVPALATIRLAGISTAGAMVALIACGVATYAALAWLRPDRQFLHDAACGTRLVDSRPHAG